MIASPTFLGLPLAGFKCINKPGPALTSTIAAPCSSSGLDISIATKSTPAMSNPTTFAAKTTRLATEGCTKSVTSKATLPLR